MVPTKNSLDTHPEPSSLQIVAPHEWGGADPKPAVQIHDPRLEHNYVYDVDEVSQIVCSQPPCQVVISLVVAKHWAQWNDTGIVDVGNCHHQ